jgi:phospholipase C
MRTIAKKKQASATIKHIFVLMLENRSFDHMLGFAGLSGTDAATGEPTRVNDLVGNSHFNVDPKDPGTQVPATWPAELKMYSPDVDPGHEFDNVLMQLCGTSACYPDLGTKKYPPINSSGFIASYRKSNSPSPAKIMKCFSPDQVPVLTALAREFAVCDHWFASMPGPTWPNRFFVHAASSGGLDDSPSSFEEATATLLDGYSFQNRTIYDRLDAKGIQWVVFMGDELPQVFAIHRMTEARIEDRFREFDQFAEMVSDPNFPYSYVFIEPSYGNVLPLTPGDYTCGSSQHCLDDVARGEKLIKTVYEAIRKSPLWNNSLLLVTYDEHGGFYDHIPPPATVSPGDKISDAKNNHHNFDFTQLGVRVPAIVISPFIPAGTIDHSTHEHCSLLAAVENVFNLDPLTDRDRRDREVNYNLAQLLSLGTPRTDAPTSLPNPAESGFHCEGDDDSKTKADDPSPPVSRGEAHPGPIEPSLRGWLHVAFLRHYRLVPEAERESVKKNFLNIRDRVDALNYMKYVNKIIVESRPKPKPGR